MGDGPYIPFYPSDWLAGTRGLTAAETGVYITLIAMMYERQEPLKQDAARLARLCGCRLDAFKRALDVLIDEGKITIEDGGLWNARVTKELSRRTEKSHVAAQNAAARWDKHKQNQAPDDADAMQAQCETDANHNHSHIRETNTHARGEVTFMLRMNDPPSPANIMDAVTIGLSKTEAENAWPKFRDHHIGVGTRFEGADQIDAKWRGWCRNELQRPRGGGPGGPGGRRNPYSALAEEIGRGLERAEAIDAGHAGRREEQGDDGEGGGVVSLDLRRACG